MIFSTFASFIFLFIFGILGYYYIINSVKNIKVPESNTSKQLTQQIQLQQQLNNEFFREKEDKKSKKEKEKRMKEEEKQLKKKEEERKKEKEIERELMLSRETPQERRVREYKEDQERQRIQLLKDNKNKEEESKRKEQEDNVLQHAGIEIPNHRIYTDNERQELSKLKLEGKLLPERLRDHKSLKYSINNLKKVPFKMPKDEWRCLRRTDDKPGVIIRRNPVSEDYLKTKFPHGRNIDDSNYNSQEQDIECLSKDGERCLEVPHDKCESLPLLREHFPKKEKTVKCNNLSYGDRKIMDMDGHWCSVGTKALSSMNNLGSHQYLYPVGKDRTLDYDKSFEEYADIIGYGLKWKCMDYNNDKIIVRTTPVNQHRRSVTPQCFSMDNKHCLRVKDNCEKVKEYVNKIGDKKSINCKQGVHDWCDDVKNEYKELRNEVFTKYNNDGSIKSSPWKCMGSKDDESKNTLIRLRDNKLVCYNPPHQRNLACQTMDCNDKSINIASSRDAGVRLYQCDNNKSTDENDWCNRAYKKITGELGLHVITQDQIDEQQRKDDERASVNWKCISTSKGITPMVMDNNKLTCVSIDGTSCLFGDSKELCEANKANAKKYHTFKTYKPCNPSDYKDKNHWCSKAYEDLVGTKNTITKSVIKERKDAKPPPDEWRCMKHNDDHYLVRRKNHSLQCYSEDKQKCSIGDKNYCEKMKSNAARLAKIKLPNSASYDLFNVKCKWNEKYYGTHWCYTANKDI